MQIFNCLIDWLIACVSCCQGASQQVSNRRPDHGSRASLEREGDRGPRGGRPASVVAPSKGLRAVFAPLVDYGDDSDEEEEPASPGDIHLLDITQSWLWLACCPCCNPACTCLLRVHSSLLVCYAMSQGSLRNQC